MTPQPHGTSAKAALRGEPSYVWRAGQVRRLGMILDATGNLTGKTFLVDGCGVGSYLSRLADMAGTTIGLDIEFERANESRARSPMVVCGAGEKLPFPDRSFDFVLSHEVIEHIQDDRSAVDEMLRVLRLNGRLILFCPNRGYPFETHGFFWHGKYHFGNIPLINYLPRRLRNKLAPHVHVYSNRDLEKLLPYKTIRVLKREYIFGSYDNIIERFPRFGKILRAFLHSLEKTPFRIFGLSHFWVVEKAG